MATSKTKHIHASAADLSWLEWEPDKKNRHIYASTDDLLHIRMENLE